MTRLLVDSPALAWVSPTTGRPLVWDGARREFSTPDGDEHFGCLDGDIPNFRPDQCSLTEQEIATFRERLGDRWRSAEAEPEPAQTVVPSTDAEARHYWRLVARAELVAFAIWCARGRRRYTQRDSMTLYRELTDVYPNALRRTVPVLLEGRPARCPLLHFKWLTLEPIVKLMVDCGVRSVLDFGCGWGANALLLKQRLPSVQVWAFDLSPQRVVSTRFNLERLGLVADRLFVADGSRLPLPDGSVDLVLTTHVLEQMDEVLPRALAEIRRVARRFACHVEPTREYARWPHRLRVRRLGYPRDIAERACGLGWKLLDRRLASPAWGRTPGELIMLEK